MNTSQQMHTPGRLLGAIAAMAMLAGCAGQATSASAQPSAANQSSATATAAPLPTRVVAPTSIITVDGTLTLAGPLISLAFDSSGKVSGVHVKPGQSVKKGDVLAELESTALTTALQQAQEKLVLQQANIDSSLSPSKQTDIDTAKASLASAYAAYNALKEGPTANTIDQALRAWNQAKNSLYTTQMSRDTTCKTDNGGKCQQVQLNVKGAEVNERAAYQSYLNSQAPTTPDKLTQAWASVVQAQSSLYKLQNNISAEDKQVYDVQLEQAKLAVERAQRDLDQAKIVSPCDCIVQVISMTVGTSAGSAVTLLDMSKLQFHTTNLTERDVVNLKAGQTATIRLKAFTQVFSGTFDSVLPLTSGTQGTTALYTAILKLDSTNVTLLPGMTGQAEINLK